MVETVHRAPVLFKREETVSVDVRLRAGSLKKDRVRGKGWC